MYVAKPPHTSFPFLLPLDPGSPIAVLSLMTSESSWTCLSGLLQGAVTELGAFILFGFVF